MQFFSRRHFLVTFWSPLLLVLVYFTLLTNSKSHHVRHLRDRFKRQQGAHLFLPGSYVTDGDDPDAGPWQEWSTPSSCTRTCGGGVSTQERQCTPGYTCQGPTKRHFSCNTQDCPDIADFRSQQCSEFDRIPFEGATYQWVPYTKAPNPCELNCMPKGERFYYRHRQRVIDGTRCNDEKLDVCVEGQCQPVGCDMMLGSNTREDKCRECGGDGSSCNTITGLLDMQDLQVGYNDILLVPAGAVNIRVREVKPSNNYLAVRNTSGYYHLNGNWRIDFPRTLEFAGCKFHYDRYPQGFSAPDSISCLGPTDEALFIVLLYQDTNVGVDYEYSVPKTIQHVTDTETYAWTFDQFTPCTASCGGGYQFRNVSCAGRKSLEPADPNLCDLNNKPGESQRCGEAPCEPRWVAKAWEKCSAPCGDEGEQIRQIYCEQIISSGVPSIVDDQQCANIQKPTAKQPCNQGVICASWHTGPWKPCNRLCGQGKEKRRVTCYRKVNDKIQALDDFECINEEKPESERSCTLRPCEGVDWVTSEWTGCENKCGLSEETRRVQCATAKGEVFADALCEEAEQRPETVRKCQSTAKGCEHEWYASQWSECSAKCGSGVQTRKVFCALVSDDGMKKVEDAKCDPLKKYDANKNCTGPQEICSGEWFTGPWSKCSKQCGGGVKTRKVICMRDNINVPVTECDSEIIPLGSEECSKQACDEDEVIPVEVTKSADVTKLAVVTEPSVELIPDEYEIVDDDEECEDGEWVDAEELPEPTGPAKEKLISLVTPSSKTTDKEPSETSLAAEDLMLSDATYYTDDESETTDAFSSGTGSGDDEITKLTTSGWETTAGFTPSEGSGDTDITIVETDFTETDEAPTGESVDVKSSTEVSEVISKSSAYTVGTDLSSKSETDVTTEESTDTSGRTESERITDTSTVDADVTEGSGDEEITTQWSTEGTTSVPASDITDVTSEAPTDKSVFTSEATAASALEGLTEAISEESTQSTPQTSTDASSESTVTVSTESTVAVSTESTAETSTESTVDVSTESTVTVSTDSTVETSSESTVEVSTQSTVEAETETSQPSSSTESVDTSSKIDTTAPEESTTEAVVNIGESDVGIEATAKPDKSTETTAQPKSTEEPEATEEPKTTEEYAISTERSSELPLSTESAAEKETTLEVSGTTEHLTSTELVSTTESATEVSEISSEVSATGLEISTEAVTTTESLASTASTELKETDVTSVSEEMTTSPEETTTSPEETGTTTVGLTGSTDSTEISTGEMSTGAPESTTEVSVSTEVTTGDTESTPMFIGVSSEIITEYDLWLSTTEGVTEDEWGVTDVVDIFKPRPKKCRRKKKPSCKTTEFGCCFDKVTPAQGPFDKGCPIPKTCNETTHGCCEDGVSPATGPEFKGCPPTHCEETLFGCCPDKKTPAEGNDDEGCPPPPPACLKSEYGCCKDNVTEAEGPNEGGCEPEVEEFTTEEPPTTTEKEDCTVSTFGCCPDGISAAQGEYFKGCADIFKEDCQKSYFKCCPDNKTSAEGPNYLGCKTECSTNPYGCCDDGVTPAHGYNKEGCCLATPHGCCPDNIKAAEGPNLEGCGCQYSPYRCCPDNITAARGYNYEGCGCQHTQHGCCPDNYTPSAGADYAGCQCHTFQFGCCPDGITAARGPHQQGCGCRNTEFGCCSDEETPSKGPNFEGCGCASSEFGCCLDGVTDAQGENFENCDDVPENLQASCSLPKERGTCRNYTVKWFYDMEYGGCSRFWYGGCDGNGNRFKSKEECQQVCVEPQGKDRCNLPQVSGPCEGYYPQWFYNKDRNHCAQFIYGGCLGNTNKFQSADECNTLCVRDRNIDACEQPQEQGPCRGNYPRWFYDKNSQSCQQFTYGGCKGNNNNFPTESACKQKCAQPGRKKVKSTCQLAAEIGECSNYTDRWYYDTTQKACRQFYYGGCGGNKNNFMTEVTCQQHCEGEKITEITTVAPPEVEEPFETQFCFLPSETGPCRKSEARWFYDRDGVCKQFLYGGCQGNRNNFQSSEECRQMCGNAQDVCSLPKVVGPCDAEYEQWYYNQSTDACDLFKYGGCWGNDNRFADKLSCEKRCKRGPLSVTVAPQDITEVGSGVTVCYNPVDPGNCSENIPAYYYDPRSQKCAAFVYTGCGGNANRYNSEEQCERQCGRFRGQDVCSLPRDVGPCEGYFVKAYYDSASGRCVEFAYGGCEGNGNRFSTIEECESICVTHEERKPNETSSANEIDTDIDAKGEHPCQKFADECAALLCPYGIDAYVDETLCNKCKCHDPCEKHDCYEGTQCAIDPNRNRTSEQDPNFVAVCRETNKPGECPPLRADEAHCEEECKNDADCALDLKCCSTGCGTACVVPTSPTEYPPAALITTSYLPAFTDSPVQAGYYPPEVIEEDFEPVVSAGEGDFALLRCAVTGNPVPKITWSKDTILIDGREPRYRLLLDGALQIISLYKSDSGIYLCTADNKIGQPLQKEIKLEVLVTVKANISLMNYKYPIGSDVSIPCDVDGYPIPQVQWYKDGRKIEPSESIQITESHRLIIHNINQSDSGEYRCEAWNQYTKSTSTTPLVIEGMVIHPNCTDNPFFANCQLIVKARYCTHKYYARFCCRSCTEAGLLPAYGPHLQTEDKQSALQSNLV